VSSAARSYAIYPGNRRQRRSLRFSTLMSSSRSGQGIPSRSPIHLQLLLSSVLPWTSRGYHVSGTVIERPSLRSTIKLSSVTTKFWVSDFSDWSTHSNSITNWQSITPKAFDNSAQGNTLGGNGRSSSYPERVW